MSFSDFYINDARKQHINLSQYAWSMIENDMFLFSNIFLIIPFELDQFWHRQISQSWVIEFFSAFHIRSEKVEIPNMEY